LASGLRDLKVYAFINKKKAISQPANYLSQDSVGSKVSR
jgi:hypothetical protein